MKEGKERRTSNYLSLHSHISNLSKSGEIWREMTITNTIPYTFTSLYSMDKTWIEGSNTSPCIKKKKVLLL